MPPGSMAVVATRNGPTEKQRPVLSLPVERQVLVPTTDVVPPTGNDPPRRTITGLFLRGTRRHDAVIRITRKIASEIQGSLEIPTCTTPRQNVASAILRAAGTGRTMATTTLSVGRHEAARPRHPEAELRLEGSTKIIAALAPPEFMKDATLTPSLPDSTNASMSVVVLLLPTKAPVMNSTDAPPPRPDRQNGPRGRHSATLP